MSIALLTSNENTKKWKTILETILEQTIHTEITSDNQKTIKHAIVSAPPKGMLQKLSNLSAIHSLWAGVEHITSDPEYPKDIPIIRMVDHGLTQGMQEYVTANIFKYHLNFDHYTRDQKTKLWAPQTPPLAQSRTVGFLGLGELGRETALYVRKLGFNVCGWSRSKKEIEGVSCFHGETQFKDFLSKCEILVNLLPHTPATTELLTQQTLQLLPKGACLINPGRGTIFNDEDLLQMLERDHIRHVTLDVFWQEPLPQDHPFWSHPKIDITPHIASVTRTETGAQTVKQNITFIENGGDIQTIRGVMNPTLNY